MAGTSSEYNIHTDIMFFFLFALRYFLFQLKFRPLESHSLLPKSIMMGDL